jgi:hypothetical protein
MSPREGTGAAFGAHERLEVGILEPGRKVGVVLTTFVCRYRQGEPSGNASAAEKVERGDTCSFFIFFGSTGI